MQDSLEDYLKLTAKSKQNDSFKISKEMVVTAQLKKECDERAMKIVEFTIEGKLRTEVFTRCLPFINQAHYQDIVEERAITKLCGYPICGKRVPDMPKKQYFISTKSNKVYDITDRKNFCSNFCYKASLHVKKQIDNSPLWLRKLEDIPEYKLLHSSEGGLPGEYIDQGVVRPLPEEVKFTSINVFAQASLGDITEQDHCGKNQNNKTGSLKKPLRLKSTMQTIRENEVEDEAPPAANESTRGSRKIGHKKSGAITKKDILRKYCVISLPSIEEKNEERLHNMKENDCGQETNVIKKVELKESLLEDVKLDDKLRNQLKEDRLKEADINPSTENQAKILSQNTTVLNTNRIGSIPVPNEGSIQIKTEEVSIKTEPPEKPLEIRSKKPVKKKQSISSNALDIENIIRRAVDDWITLETCIFIHGEQKVRHLLNEKKLSDYFEELHAQELQREQQMRYIDICRRLQLQEMADDKFDNVIVGGNKLKPLPDYKKLKEETKDILIKVKSFYEGTMYEQEDKNFPTKMNNKQSEAEVPEKGPPAVLPPVDANSQNLLRRKIFLNALSKAIQQLLQSLGASYSAVLSDVQALVKTFNLKADNITFKPIVWTYIAVVLLHLLSLKDQSLNEVLKDQRTQEYVKILFDAVPSKRNFISDVLRNVKDIELFVERYITKKDSN